MMAYSSVRTAYPQSQDRRQLSTALLRTNATEYSERRVGVFLELLETIWCRTIPGHIG